MEQVDAIARGRVRSGAQARERGLVDEFGGLQDAVADAARRVKLGEGKYRVHYIEKAATPFSQFLGGFAGSHVGASLLKDSPCSHCPGTHDAGDRTRSCAGRKAVRDRNGAPVKALAYRFCGL